jgi:NAD(P)H-hydrate epimerase
MKKQKTVDREPGDAPAPALELLSVAQMAQADRLAVAAGTPSIELMENAGASVVRHISARYSPKPTVVLCGPGNNGGDGYVVARLLARAGWPVRISALDKPSGDAAVMAKLWTGEAGALNGAAIGDAELIVDAIFGAGLDRAISGDAALAVQAANASGRPIVAVDVPSGIDGDTGEVRGHAVRAASTVTFFRKKPGHLLLPGSGHCGELAVADIGIGAMLLEKLDCRAWENQPALWRGQFPRPAFDGNKYTRGHAVVRAGGLAATGAARLAARAALRAGAGLVTLVSPTAALAVNAAQLTAIMLIAADSAGEFAKFLSDPRRNAVLIGPGNGVDQATRDAVKAAASARKATVLDADALSVFADRPDELFAAIKAAREAVGDSGAPWVLTPHEGEFARLFKLKGSKLERAREAAKIAGAIILLKGADTVVASPDGRASIVNLAPAELATAGSGDVLGGFVLGLLTQGMAPFAAASAAAWLHAETGRSLGLGLIAEDLPEALPMVLRRLF